jgi:hypothetical protein
MANTNLSMSLVRGTQGFKDSDWTFGTLATNAGDMEFRMNALDLSGNPQRRIDAVQFLKAALRVIESGGLYTVENNS